jgi:hypothetical protein
MYIMYQGTRTYKLIQNMNYMSNIKSYDCEINKASYNVTILSGIHKRCTKRAEDVV